MREAAQAAAQAKIEQEVPSETKALIELVGAAVGSQTYDAFAAEVEALKKRVAVYRTKYQARDSATTGKIVQTVEALVNTAQAWKSELNVARDVALLRTQVQAASQSAATPAARASLADNRRRLEAAVATQETAARGRTESFTRARSLFTSLHEGGPPQVGSK
jgi:hypothetical protein